MAVIFRGTGRIKHSEMLQRTPEITDQKAIQLPAAGSQPGDRGLGRAGGLHSLQESDFRGTEGRGTAPRSIACPYRSRCHRPGLNIRASSFLDRGYHRDCGSQ